MAKRIALFLAVNVLVIVMVSIIMAVFGVQPYLTRWAETEGRTIGQKASRKAPLR